MANLTISIDEETLRRARIRALEQGTSVNAVLREYLDAYIGEHPAGRALDELVELARAAKSSSGKSGRRWNRDEAHER
jgi:plasmid stability protein